MNGAPRSRLQIIVLAAGFSSRFGRSKALMRVHGVSLLTRTLRRAAEMNASGIIVVVPPNAARYRAQARGMKVSFIANAQRRQGLSSSVRCGLAKALYAPAVLFMPVDLVHLKGRELSRLVRRWRSAPRAVIARRVKTGFGAVPLILPRRFYSLAQHTAGDIGLRELIAQLPPEARVLVNLPSAAFDVDTPQDLMASARWRRR